MFKPELLSPAGTLRNMRYAFDYGADAVYAGQPRYSLRVRNNSFDSLETLQTGIDEAHARNKQFYLAVNISPHNSKIKTFMKDTAEVIALKPDALIMADPGLIMLVRENWPDMPVHLSVQANTVNYASVKFWYQQGLTRVILSRELGLEEIEEIRQQCPEMELEVFVHGALCIAYSGRCLLSGYLNHRDPNQGTCTNSCRWKYDTKEATTDESGDIVPLTPEPKDMSQRVFLIEEEKRPGEAMPAFEDEHGTYIMNSKDLRAIQHVAKLTELGIASLKIEGRTKSHYYAARTAQVYRRAIDEAAEGKEFDFNLMTELDNLANRGYTEGFYRRHVPKEYQNYKQNASFSDKQQFVGEVSDYDTDTGWTEIQVKNHFEVADHFELMRPQGNFEFTLEKMLDKNRVDTQVAKGSGHVMYIHLPDQAIPVGSLLLKNFPQS